MLNIHLGGIPMIADDMMSYIKSDIVYLELEFLYLSSSLFGLFSEI